LQINATSTNINRTTAGRDAFGFWVGQSIFSQKSFKDLAYEIVIATGNTYNLNTGAANFMLNMSTPMGPIQDTYDTALAKTAATFLGLAYYDCLLCHNGRGHLDQISLWGSNVTRVEAEKMAAFFSRLRLNRCGTPQGAPPDPAKPACGYNSYDVMNVAAGSYDLTTTYGNRPNRVPIGTVRTLTPEYRETGATPAGEWRDSFADNMVRDPMFTRNIANRLWKALFNLGLVDPVDTMDPARLDPKNPPPAPWTLQATHPELLEKLAEEFARRNFSLREFIRLLVESSAYQLSSRYDNEWKVDYVPLFARHYPRRLEGEEVHDAMAKATGVMGSYLLPSGDRVYWAMQLPEPAEPRSDSTGLGAADFMNTFFRGNRDTQQRSQAGSIQQQLALMNSAFVTNRLKVASAPRLKEISAITSNEELLDQIFLLFLSRWPTDYERSRGLAFLSKATTTAMRNAAIEDLAWVCVNKGDFLFSY